MIGSLVLAAAAVATPSADLCKGETACSREYSPTICSVEGKTFTGSNKCEAVKKLKASYCGSEKKLKEEKIVCKSKVDLSIKAVKCETGRMCTSQFEPTVCFYNGKQVKGTNLCSVSLKIEAIACKAGLEGKPLKVQCGQEPKKQTLLP